MTEPSIEKQRIDKWIWHARFIKTRSLAQKLITSGKIRINTEKVTSTSRQLKIGDTLTIAIHDQVRIIRVEAIADRRGPFSEAKLLYEDLSPVVEAKRKSTEPTIEEMSKIESSGRPSKQQRRQIMQMKRNSTK